MYNQRERSMFDVFIKISQSKLIIWTIVSYAVYILANLIYIFTTEGAFEPGIMIVTYISWFIPCVMFIVSFAMMIYSAKRVNDYYLNKAFRIPITDIKRKQGGS